MRAEDITVELNISTPLLAGFPLLPVVDFIDVVRRRAGSA